MTDRDRLSELGGVQFTDDDVAEWEELLRTYRERWQDGLAHDNILVSGLLPVPDPRELRLRARRAVVEHVADLWVACRGRGSGAYKIKVLTDEEHETVYKTQFEGRLLDLLEEFFRQAGDPQTRATLYHDVQFLRTGTERKRGR